MRLLVIFSIINIINLFDYLFLLFSAMCLVVTSPNTPLFYMPKFPLSTLFQSINSHTFPSSIPHTISQLSPRPLCPFSLSLYLSLSLFLFFTHTHTHTHTQTLSTLFSLPLSLSLFHGLSHLLSFSFFSALPPSLSRLLFLPLSRSNFYFPRMCFTRVQPAG